MSILQITNSKKYYGTEPNITRVLDDLTFSVEQKEASVAVVGTSGSRKSTLLHMMGDFDIPTSGSVRVRDKELAKINDEQLIIFHRYNVGFIFQNYNPVLILNVYENIVLLVELDGDTMDQKFMDGVVSMLALEGKLYNMQNNLSNGQQKRVAISCALVTKLAIVLADKPTGSLDNLTGAEVLGLLKCTSDEFNQTIVMIPHNNETLNWQTTLYRLRTAEL